MIDPDNRHCNSVLPKRCRYGNQSKAPLLSKPLSFKQQPKQPSLRQQPFKWLSCAFLLCLSLASVGTVQAQAHTQKQIPLQAQSIHQSLSTQELKQQCRPLMEGSQSLIAAFQSGQCSSYILGIYDLVASQCSDLTISRDQAVRSTLNYLSTLENRQTLAVKAINHFLSARSRCLPVASL